MSGNEDVVVVGRNNNFLRTPSRIGSKELKGFGKSNPATSVRRKALATLNLNSITECRTADRPKQLANSFQKNEEKVASKKTFTKDLILEDDCDDIENMIIERKPTIDTYEDVIPLNEQPTTYIKKFVHWFPVVNHHIGGVDNGSSGGDDNDYLKSNKDFPESPKIQRVKGDGLKRMSEEVMFDLPEYQPMHFFDDLFF